MIIDRVREKLAKHQNVRFTADAHAVRIHPEPGGFEVGLSTDNNSFTVSFEGWHEEFQEEEKALNCLAFGLSESCRLRVLRKGSVDYKWIVEAKTGSEWRPDSEVGLLAYPFWGFRKERILQNHVIPLLRHELP